MPDATGLTPDARVRHYWDPERVVGEASREELGLSDPAWDVWLPFGRDATWRDGRPSPDWWEHQLNGLADSLHLDPERFASEATGLLSAPPPPGS